MSPCMSILDPCMLSLRRLRRLGATSPRYVAVHSQWSGTKSVLCEFSKVLIGQNSRWCESTMSNLWHPWALALKCGNIVKVGSIIGTCGAVLHIYRWTSLVSLALPPGGLCCNNFLWSANFHVFGACMSHAFCQSESTEQILKLGWYFED